MQTSVLHFTQQFVFLREHTENGDLRQNIKTCPKSKSPWRFLHLEMKINLFRVFTKSTPSSPFWNWVLYLLNIPFNKPDGYRGKVDGFCSNHNSAHNMAVIIGVWFQQLKRENVPGEEKFVWWNLCSEHIYKPRTPYDTMIVKLTANFDVKSCFLDTLFVLCIEDF